ncbi:hypothetical protein GCM10027073_30630 [Streptomyces chlorus]
MAGAAPAGPVSGVTAATVMMESAAARVRMGMGVPREECVVGCGCCRDGPDGPSGPAGGRRGGTRSICRPGRPAQASVAGNDAGTPIPAVRMPYRVSAKDPEVLEVTATTAGCDCRWYLELDWSSGGRSGTVRIDDDGRPFRTSGIKGLPRYEYDTSHRRWTPRTG